LTLQGLSVRYPHLELGYILEDQWSEVGSLPHHSFAFLSTKELLLKWKTPQVLSSLTASEREAYLRDHSNLLVLTDVWTRSGQHIATRLDGISSLIQELWPTLGKLILPIFMKVVTSTFDSRAATEIFLPPWPSSQYTLSATHDELKLTAIATIVEWNSVVDCLVWIDDLVGSPPEKGFYKRRGHAPKDLELVGSIGENVLEPLHPVGEYSVLFPVPLSDFFLDTTPKLVKKTHERDSPGWRMRKQKQDTGKGHAHRGSNSPETATSRRSQDSNPIDRPILSRSRSSHRGAQGNLDIPGELVLQEFEQVEFSSKCWAGLIEKAYVGSYILPFYSQVECAHIGKGLQISFELMISIAGIEKVILDDKGLILVGFQLALVPIRRIDVAIVQWHLIEFPDSGSAFRSAHNREDFWDHIPGERLPATSIKEVDGLAYIGWHSHVEIIFPSSNEFRNVKRSESAKLSEKWVLKERCVEVGSVFGISNIASVQLNAAQTHQLVSTRFNLLPSRIFCLRVDSMTRKSVIIYDSESRKGWLCPMLNVLIFMMQLYIHKHGYKSDHATLPICAISSFCRTSDTHDIEVIKSLETKRIESNKKLTYGQLMTHLSTKYERAFSFLNGVRKKKIPDNLIGFELLDIIEGDTGLASLLPVKQGVKAWAALARDGDLMFCKGLGDVIAPVNSSIDISPCSSMVPNGHDILTCPVGVLRERLDQFGYYAAENGFVRRGSQAGLWAMTAAPYKCSASRIGKDCDGTLQSCWDDRLQRIEDINSFGMSSIVKTAIKFKRTQSSGNQVNLAAKMDLRLQHVNGALCFGNNLTVKWYYSKLPNTQRLTSLCRAERQLSRIRILSKLLLDQGEMSTSQQLDSLLLHWAVENYRNDILSDCIKEIANVDCRDSGGQTALHVAAEFDNSEAATTLLRANVSANALDIHQRTALHVAVGFKASSVFDILLKVGGNIALQDDSGSTAMHMAAKQSDLRYMEALLERLDTIARGSRNQSVTSDEGNVKPESRLDRSKIVNLRDKIGRSPLHWAVETGEANMVRILLQSKAIVDMQDSAGESPLSIALRYGDPEVVQILLLEGGAPVNEQDSKGRAALHHAVETRNPKIVQLILDGGADICARDNDGQTALHVALADFGKGELVKHKGRQGETINVGVQCTEGRGIGTRTKLVVKIMSLLMNSAWDNGNLLSLKEYKRGDTALHLAVGLDSTEVVEHLIVSGASLILTNNAGNTPFEEALTRAHEKAMILLLKRGADVNSTTVDGNNCLHVAARSGNCELLNIAISRQCKLDAQNIEYGHTPLHVAAAEGNNEAAVALIDAGAEIGLVTKLGNTALHLAAGRCSSDVVKKLLEAGADINALNVEGMTPLLLAASEKQSETIQILMKAGAKNLKDKHGHTPRDIAAARGFFVLELFRNHKEN